MLTKAFFRGGPSLKPRPHDVRIDRATGLVLPTHGVSVYDRPDGLASFGGAYRIVWLPGNLRIIQRGRDPHHFEMVAVRPMTPLEYETALNQVLLAPA